MIAAKIPSEDERAFTGAVSRQLRCPVHVEDDPVAHVFPLDPARRRLAVDGDLLELRAAHRRTLQPDPLDGGDDRAERPLDPAEIVRPRDQHVREDGSKPLAIRRDARDEGCAVGRLGEPRCVPSSSDLSRG